MNCGIIEDKILDYVDGELSNDEEKRIKEHLDNCIQCENIYKELVSSINHLGDLSGKIDTSKKINVLSRTLGVKPIRRITRTGLIAVILSLMVVVSVFATDMFGFIKWWKEDSEERILAWKELIENGVGERLDISVTDKDIRVTAEGVIADELNTIIIVKIEDLKGNIRFTPASWDAIRVDGDISRMQEWIPPLLNYTNLYADEENTIRLMLKTEAMTQDEGNVEIYISKLQSMINENEESIVEVSGNWNLTIPANKIKSKSYKVNEIIDVDGNELIIERITLAPTATNIEYRFKKYSHGNEYMISNISFLINYKSKIYGKSKLVYMNDLDIGSYGYSIGSVAMDSLYIEDPNEIGLIVETYRFDTVGSGKYYDIDINNLPQIIEHYGSKITIEDIILNKDSTDIIIKEDTSRKRKYIKSKIEVKAKNNYYIRQYTTYTKFERRDDKGIVKDSENKDWNSRMYHRILEQKITLENDNRRRQLMNTQDVNYGLIPDKIYIKSQEFIKYPNIERNIKLK